MTWPLIIWQIQRLLGIISDALFGSGQQGKTDHALAAFMTQA